MPFPLTAGVGAAFVRNLFLVTALMALASSGTAQDSQIIPLDPLVRTGTLDNGLQYFIRENSEPADRLEMRLIVNAGSVLEEEDQRGLAHFVEHMLFNGTKRFPKQSLIEFFERIGMRFGADVNAYTSFDETVYTLQVPTDNTEDVQMAFEVLRDWTAHATMDPVEVDLERGVILEEWRRGRGASGRVNDQVLPVLLAGSPYANRLPIGDTLSIMQSPHEALRRFYDDWYRPDLMAVVLVGDLSADSLERLAVDHFAPLKARAEPKARPQAKVPGYPGTRYQTITDAELTVTTVNVYYRLPQQGRTTVEDFRSSLVGRLATGITNRRLAEIARDGTTAPFLWARLARSGLVRHYDAYALTAQVHEDSLLTGYEAAHTELARLVQHGVTEAELHRQKAVVQRAAERGFAERDHTSSATLAARLTRHYLTGEAWPGIASGHDLTQSLLPGITREHVNEYLESIARAEDRLVVVTMPDSRAPGPTAAELQEAEDRAVAQHLHAYDAEELDAPLVGALRPPGTVVDSLRSSEFGYETFALDNGVRIVIRPTDFKADEVLFTGFRDGGTSHYSDEAYAEAQFAGAIVQRSGVGTFDQSSLRQKLAGKLVRVTPYLSEYSEGFSGQASSQDLETLFQLIYLYFSAPRADEAALRSFQNHQQAYLANRSSDPASAFSDSLFKAFYGDHPRRQLLDEEDIARLKTTTALEVFKQRFADAGGFTFVFVGSVTSEQIVPLAESYLGSLPGVESTRQWRDVEPDLPEGIVRKAAYKGMEPQARVGLTFHGPIEFSLENEHLLNSLQLALRTRIREELREKRGGIYSASVQAGIERVPRTRYTFAIYFDCAPDRVEELTAAVFEEIEKIKAGGSLKDVVPRIKAQQRQQQRSMLETNLFWLAALQEAFQHDEPLVPESTIEQIIASLTEADLHESARTWLGGRYVHVTLLPESE